MSPERSPGVREAGPGGVRLRRGQGPAGVGQRVAGPGFLQQRWEKSRKPGWQQGPLRKPRLWRCAQVGKVEATRGAWILDTSGGWTDFLVD